jgi:hypothetical protein
VSPGDNLGFYQALCAQLLDQQSAGGVDEGDVYSDALANQDQTASEEAAAHQHEHEVVDKAMKLSQRAPQEASRLSKQVKNEERVDSGTHKPTISTKVPDI